MDKITTSILEAIRDCIEQQFGGNVTKFAEAAGVGSAPLFKWLSGDRSPSLKALAPIMEFVGMHCVLPGAEIKGFDLVAKVKAKAGAGASLEVSDEISGYYAFRSDFMGKMNLHAKQCVLMDIVGDSMTPTISDGDTVLIDQSDKTIMDGKIYVVTLGDELRAKRISKGFDCVRLVSDNKAYEPIQVGIPDIDRLVIHGRVRWVGKCL